MAGFFSKSKEKTKRWKDLLRAKLTKTRKNFRDGLISLFERFRGLDDSFCNEVEELLVQADVGVKTTEKIIEELKKRAKTQKVKDFDTLVSLLKEVMLDVFQEREEKTEIVSLRKPEVVLMVGVNGTGKTTTIAKMAYQAKKEGKKILLAAADTYRAAAIEQLSQWANKVGVDVVKHKRGSDAAAVVFDAISSAKAKGIDLLIVDTAGRLHTYTNLMEELKKIKRVAEREAGTESVKTYLVIDAVTGQNALFQARQFNEALGLDGIVLTKLDGTAKGGIILGIYDELKVPVKFIGVGEDLDDFLEFKPSQFVSALLEQ